MRVLFVINSFGAGGAERQVVSLVKEHLERGNQVLVVRMKSTPDDLLEDLAGVPTYSLGMDSIGGALACLSRFRLQLNKFKPDVVHAHLPHSIVFCRLAKIILRYKCKLVSSAHNYNIRTKFFGVAYKYTDFVSDHNTNVSETAVGRYIDEGIFSSVKSSYMPNGFAVKSDSELDSYKVKKIREELRLSSEDYVCCAIGRLDYQKNYDMMLCALKKVVAQDDTFKLVVLGGGPEEQRLKVLVEDLGLERHVLFLGVVKDVYKYLAVSDLYLMTSLFEGMPLAICEAMISRTPIVVTNFSGVGEFTKDYYTPVPMRDTDGFARAMIEAKSKDFRFAIDSARANVVANYSIESVVSRWEALYERT